MTTFPAFRPDAWPLEHGDFPASEETAIGGETSIVRHSSYETGRSTSLTFTLTQAEFEELLVHSELHGSHAGFAFVEPTLPANYTPAGHLWYYSAAPNVEDLHEDFFVVSCSFVSRFVATFALPAEVADVEVEPEEDPPTITPAPPGAPTLSIPNVSGSAATAITSNPQATVGDLDARGGWQYSIDGGATWTTGTGTTFRVPAGSYPVGGIRARQVEGAVPGASTGNTLPLVVLAPSVAATALAVPAGGTVTGVLRLPPTYLATRIACTLPGWLTIYASAATMAADASRLRTEWPPRGRGIFHDPVFTAEELDIRLASLEAGANGETPATNLYPFRFRNDGGAGELIVTVYHVPISSL